MNASIGYKFELVFVTDENVRRTIKKCRDLFQKSSSNVTITSRMRMSYSP